MPDRIRRFVRQEQASLRLGMLAVLAAACADLGAGASLGFATEAVARVPGLLILIPSAIAARGATFGAFGARCGTAIHLGQFDPELASGSFLRGQLRAIYALTLITSIWAAVASIILALAFGVGAVDAAGLLVTSVVGGILASGVLVGVTLFLSRNAYARGWDMDDVGAPAITATGDLVSIPALVLAAQLAGRGTLTTILALVAIVASVIGVTVAWYRSNATIRRIIRESTPVLLVAAGFSVMAGIVVETRSETFFALPGLLVLFPAFMAMFGALGGILASRLTSKLHLGVIKPSAIPARGASVDFILIGVFSIVVFTFIGFGASGTASALGLVGPATWRMVLVSLCGGLVGTVILAGVAWTAATATFRLRLDPDNVAIPIVTSVMDFAGMLCLAGALTLLL